MFIRRLLLIATGSYLLSFALSALFPDYAGIAFRLFATGFAALLLLELALPLMRLFKIRLHIERLLMQMGYVPAASLYFQRAPLRLTLVYFLIFLGMYELLFPLFHARTPGECLLLALFYALVLFGVSNARNFFLLKRWSIKLALLDIVCGTALVFAAILILTALLRVTMLVL